MKNANLFLIPSLLIMVACGSDLNRSYTGTKTSQYGSAQITMILTENGENVNGTWTSSGGTQYGGMIESGSLTAQVNGNVLQNVSWISNSNQNQTSGCNTPFAGTIQISDGGKGLTGFLNAQASSAANCPTINQSVTLSLQAAN